MKIQTEEQLAAISVALIGGTDRLSPQEQTLASAANGADIDLRELRAVRQGIANGEDPLGDAFISIRSATGRRSIGAIYTPQSIVRSMMGWMASQSQPVRIVDPGAGSGRFTLAAGQAFPDCELVAVEKDPLAVLMLRANVHVRGWTRRTRILVADYRSIELEPCKGVTVFIGNPPYVRHHDIEEHWKAWYSARFAEFGIKASTLAGLHLYFFLKTRLLAAPGDLGMFITSAEWLDVNYGASLRRLLMDELGGVGLSVLEPTLEPFPGTITTAAITCFRVGETERPVRVRSISTLEGLDQFSCATDVQRTTIRSESRWSVFVRPQRPSRNTEIELGELFRVHRGQVTGANDVWIASSSAIELPERVQIPTVTKAKDLINAGDRLESASSLRRVIDLPCELDELSAEEQVQIHRYLAWARTRGADQSYVARHRRAWWSVGLKSPAPILCTYMARRPPQFTLNICEARHINIAHGLYPRGEIDQNLLRKLVGWLNQNIGIGGGRTYAGGLTKFEPKEIERLRVPRLETLAT